MKVTTVRYKRCCHHQGAVQRSHDVSGCRAGAASCSVLSLAHVGLHLLIMLAGNGLGPAVPASIPEMSQMPNGSDAPVGTFAQDSQSVTPAQPAPSQQAGRLSTAQPLQLMPQVLGAH